MAKVTLFVELHGDTKAIQVMRTYHLPAWLAVGWRIETFLGDCETAVESAIVYADDGAQECQLSDVRCGTDAAMEELFADARMKGWEFCDEYDLENDE